MTPAAVAALAGTLALFVAADRLDRRVRSPWTNPVGITVAIGIAVVALGVVELPDYERGTAPLVVALRPAVVALGWLAYRQRATLRRWRLTGAWPVKFVAGEWDNNADENVIESVTLTYDVFTLE